MAYEIHTENSQDYAQKPQRNCTSMNFGFSIRTYMCAERTTCFFNFLCRYFFSISVTLELVILWRASLLLTLLRLAEI